MARLNKIGFIKIRTNIVQVLVSAALIANRTADVVNFWIPL